MKQTTNENNPGRNRITEWLLNGKAKGVFNSRHFWILLSTSAVLAVVYYLFLGSFYDIYMVLFFCPLIYAAIAYRLRGVLICGVILLAIALPRIIIFSNDTYALIRTLFIGAFAFIISSLSAILLDYVEWQKKAFEEISVLHRELSEYTTQLETTQNKLVRSEKLKAIGQISASIAHEINNPLAGILVYTRLLSKKLQNDTLDKDEALSQLKKIDDAVSHTSRIIGGLLDFSRRADPVFKPSDINSIIDQSLVLVGHQVERKKIQLVRENDANLPQIYADSSQIVQVLINLINNAVQATDIGGKITIRTSLSSDKMVQIEVIDTGIGISEEHMNKLFTPFFSTKSEIKGVGIGLWISYRIITNHGGRISVSSRLGKGSTFTIQLPPCASGETSCSLPKVD